MTSWPFPVSDIPPPDDETLSLAQIKTKHGDGDTDITLDKIIWPNNLLTSRIDKPKPNLFSLERRKYHPQPSNKTWLAVTMFSAGALLGMILTVILGLR